jgi:hypothetical protein
MRLIGLAVVLTVGLTLAPLAAEGQQAGKVCRVGILWFGREPVIPSDFAVLRRSLADAGYVEGTNLSFCIAGREVALTASLTSRLNWSVSRSMFCSRVARWRFAQRRKRRRRFPS